MRKARMIMISQSRFNSLIAGIQHTSCLFWKILFLWLVLVTVHNNDDGSSYYYCWGFSPTVISQQHGLGAGKNKNKNNLLIVGGEDVCGKLNRRTSVAVEVAASTTEPTSSSTLSEWISDIQETIALDANYGSPTAKEIALDEKDEIAIKYDNGLFFWAGFPPILAFAFQEDIAKTIAYVIDRFGFKGTNVDGNAFAANLLRPTINGVVGKCRRIKLMCLLH